MDLFRLDSQDQTPIAYGGTKLPTYLPDALIEGYTSLIWTERYDTPGDFELKTPLVDETMALLPSMSLLSLRDSREVMFVETRSIDYDSDGNKELTITGRSLMAFLEYRSLPGRQGADYYNKKYFMINNFWSSEAVLIMLWNAFNNSDLADYTQANYAYQNIRTQIQNFAVTESYGTTGTKYHATRWLEAGPLYPQVMAFVREDGHGLRGLRPDGVSGLKTVASVNKTTGYPSYSTITPYNGLALDLYRGYDLSLGYWHTPIVFSYAHGHINNPKYLYSNKGALTDFRFTHVYGSTGHSRSGDANRWGLDFRQDTKVAADPDATGTSTDYMANLTNEVDAELLARNFTQYFTGDISPDNPYEYGIGKDYYLGDTVTLLGEYGFQQNMRVSEYVRTEDSTGELGYPGLAML